MTNPIVAVCLVVRDRPHPKMVMSLLHSDIPRPAITLMAHGKYVDVARNELVRDALDFVMPETGERVTHLLWIDDDMVFAGDYVKRLLVRDLPIVGGLCYNRHHPYPPILMHKPPKGHESLGYLYRHEEFFPDPPGVVEVDATGAAFVLVKREVYEKIAESLGPNEGPYSQRGWGEDVSFCTRAAECGFKTFVDTSITVGHVGEVIVDTEFAKRNRRLKLNEWTPTINVTKCGLRILGNEATSDGIMHRERYRWAAKILNETSLRTMILDYGCGTGHGVKTLRDKGFLAYGYDPDEDALAWGRKEFGLGTFISSDDRMIMQKFDAVIAFEVIEHLSDAPITTLRRLLSYAPTVIGSVPFMEPHGFNPHHVYSGLNQLNFRDLFQPFDGEADVTFFFQRWNGAIREEENDNIPVRQDTPIMLFVARRRS